MPANSRGGGNDKFYNLLLSPLVLLIPIAIVTAAFSSGVNVYDFHPSFVAGGVCVYIMMGIVYAMLGKKRGTKAMAAASAISNGTSLLLLSIFFGDSPVFTMAGFVILLVGMMVIVTSIAPQGESLFARKVDNILSQNVEISEFKKILDSIQYPCVFLEKNPNRGDEMMAANSAFVKMFGLNDKNIMGGKIDTVLPEYDDNSVFKHKGEQWQVKRTVKGKQILLMLSPLPKTKEALKIEVFDSIDPLTGLYMIGFMKHKARSDIESIIRGKRKMSVVLFRLVFNVSEVEPSDDEKTICYIALGKIAMASIRVCDSAYKVASNEILLLMPDTPSLGADKVVLRIYAAMKKMASVECPSLSKARLVYAQRDFVGGTDLPHYDKILLEMTTTFNATNAISKPA
ncbi:MAG: hypothetical protein LBT08_00035 [Synergistaceae bacterium]|jgi:hypothetical protein|nr:hypothetical protein [Synergistaceae bacterium]